MLNGLEFRKLSLYRQKEVVKRQGISSLFTFCLEQIFCVDMLGASSLEMKAFISWP